MGHFEPMVPLARALAAAGHEVLFATGPAFRPAIEAKGFAARAAGLDLDALIAATPMLDAAGAKLPPDRHAGRMFAQIAPRAMLRPLLDIGRAWHPDILVHEEVEYAAPLAAVLLGVPSVCVGWPSPMRAPEQLDRLGGILAGLWQEAGLAPAPYGNLFRHLFLDPCPPPLQTDFGRSLPTARPIRPVDPPGDDRPPAPDWLRTLPPGPLVHATFGTVSVYNSAPDLFAAIAQSLAGEDVNLILTIGRDNDPAALGPLSPNVRVEGFIPHAELLPHCDAVVSHGGAGSTVSPLAHGLPLLIIPGGGAAQRRNGHACAASGVGRTLDRADASLPALREAILDVLRTPGYRAGARAVAAEIRRMPPPEQAVGLVEALAAAGR